MALTDYTGNNPIYEELKNLSPAAKQVVLAGGTPGAGAGPAAAPRPMAAPTPATPPVNFSQNVPRGTFADSSPAAARTLATPTAPLAASSPLVPDAAAGAHPLPAPTPTPTFSSGSTPNIENVAQRIPSTPLTLEPPGPPGLGTVEGAKQHLADIESKPAALESVYGRIAHSDFGQSHPFLGKLLGGLAQVPSTALDVGLSAAVPRLGMMIPGTSLRHGLQVQGGERGLSEAEADAEKEAQTREANARTDASKLVEISPDEAQAMGNPSLAGQHVTQGVYQHLLTNAQSTQGKKDVANITADARRDVADTNARVKEEVSKLKPEQRDDRAIRILSTPEAQRSQDDNAYLSAYDKWIQQTKVQPGVERAAAFASFRPVQVIGDNGDVKYMQAGQAERGGNATPGSMNFRTALGVQKAFTSGPQSAQLTAFRTATDHLELMKAAAAALQNGDVQALNKLENAFKTQMGRSAPTNAKALSEMLSGELASALSKGGATVSEIDHMRDQINAAANSPEQMSGLIDTNQDVINEKANELLKQYQEGSQGRPVFEPLSSSGTNPTQQPHLGGAGPSNGGTPKVNDTRNFQGKTYRFKGGDQYDQKNWEEVKK